jgi:hypothetical protein
MRKFRSVVLASVAAVVLGGAAIAASPNSHLLTVPLPDGSVARIEYFGDVAPRVTIAPRTEPLMGAMIGPDAAPFGTFDRWAADLRREIEAMTRQMDADVAAAAGAVGPELAAYGKLPAGSTSVTVISTSNGKDSCTRTTQVTSYGPGKAPKVVTNLSGNCASAIGSAPKPGSSAGPTNPAPVNRT